MKKVFLHIINCNQKISLLLIAFLLAMAPLYHGHSESIEEVEEDRKEWIYKSNYTVQQKPDEESHEYDFLPYRETFKACSSQRSSAKLYLTFCCRRTYD